MPDIKPIPDESSESIDQAHMVTPASDEEGMETEHDARGGGEISTAAYSEEETRPQRLHGAKAYQELTGEVPEFRAYTDLTKAKGRVEGQ